jgi:hypothetical protein
MKFAVSEQGINQLRLLLDEQEGTRKEPFLRTALFVLQNLVNSETIQLCQVYEHYEAECKRCNTGNTLAPAALIRELKNLIQVD